MVLQAALDGFRHARLQAYRSAVGMGWVAKVGAAAGFAGFLALMSQVSVPLPWTPVPFTMQVLAVYLIGAYLGPRYALVSMGMYLVAGAIGFHVFAPSPPGAASAAYNTPDLWAPERWKVLVPDLAAHTGSSAGYILGWVLAAAFVGAYVRRRNARLDGPFLWTAVCGLVFLLGIVALGSLFVAQDGTLAGGSSGAQYDASFDTVVLFVGAASVAIPLVLWALWRSRGGSEAVNLFVVLMAATAIIHFCGVIVLKLVLDWSWQKAAALGTTVFLPFDALKAGLAVLLSLPFLPTRSELEQTAMSQPEANA